MKLIFTFTTAALLFFLMGSCNNENSPNSSYSSSKFLKKQKLGAFSSVEILAPVNIEIEQGSTYLMTYDGDSIFYQNLIFNIDNDTLFISSKKNINLQKTPQIILTLPDLKSVEIDGAATVAIADFYKQSALNLNIDGSGIIRFGDFEGIKKLAVSIDGSGLVESSKKINSLEEVSISIDGSGSVNTLKTASTFCDVSINGAGNAEVNAIKQLDVIIDGVGNVSYEGTPTITKSISGLGSVKHH